MIEISLCMIVRNEEQSLPRCLSSVRGLADEIIIVDTGSDDQTKEIARSFGAVIRDFTWIDDFSAARNFAFSQATKEYIFWLDADDYLKEEDQLLFRRLKESFPDHVDSVNMQYNLAFDGEGKVVTSLRRNRLVRRSCGFKWIGPVHEYLEVYGPSYSSEVCITHEKDKAYTDRNLRIYRKRAAERENFSPRDQYYYANELRDHGIHAEASRYYEQFLDGGQGWIEDNIQACLRLAECRERLGDTGAAFTAMTRSLQYDAPRAEFCCRLGAWHVEKGQLQQAVYWYELALMLPRQNASMGVKNEAYATWLPNLQLALCYDRLGQHERANLFNEAALLHLPSHPSMLYNRNYFRNLLGDKYVSLQPKELAGEQPE
ncbi:glycosyltransferase family 2 protein [Paenibacillus sp. MMS20-IR301]|uniref:tetratricopeptide repeat-containing glycosyltransferase family 2 protein n=1 Tax=Paenibacillus sp. MMS20-IR301 TaxID=2895946 RepID=UPI0028E5E1A1|nr:glycosyltransferase family 2 protein [Paenibacillus sp. MMS20-IR301]WNS45948.1 glycosyltransferase family 2 protein [Paenibacillus sp. MMS20-IR301]